MYYCLLLSVVGILHCYRTDRFELLAAPGVRRLIFSDGYTGKKEKKSNTNAIVRVTQDTPEFVGTNMKTYSLRKDDVLTLPKEMSEPLLKRGVVEQIK